MALLEAWRKVAYDTQGQDRNKLQQMWNEYFALEKGVYEQLLTNPEEEVRGTVEELADKYDLSLMYMTAFLDGINESLVEPNPIEEMEKDTPVNPVFDKEKLFRNMVDAKADWLYTLPQWEKIYDQETRDHMIREVKNSNTYRRETKIYPNDPCPCGSGKKYKKCHGRNV